MEGEVTAHDGHPRGRGERPRFFRTCHDGEFPQQSILVGEAFVVLDVGFREGNRVSPVRVHRDVVAANQDGHHGHHGRCLGGTFAGGESVDGFPRLGHRLVDDPVEAVVDLHDEPLEGIFGPITRVLFAVAWRVRKLIITRVLLALIC